MARVRVRVRVSRHEHEHLTVWLLLFGVGKCQTGSDKVEWSFGVELCTVR